MTKLHRKKGKYEWVGRQFLIVFVSFVAHLFCIQNLPACELVRRAFLSRAILTLFRCGGGGGPLIVPFLLRTSQSSWLG